MGLRVEWKGEKAEEHQCPPCPAACSVTMWAGNPMLLLLLPLCLPTTRSTCPPTMSQHKSFLSCFEKNNTSVVHVHTVCTHQTMVVSTFHFHFCLASRVSFPLEFISSITASFITKQWRGLDVSRIEHLLSSTASILWCWVNMSIEECIQFLRSVKSRIIPRSLLQGRCGVDM